MVSLLVPKKFFDPMYYSIVAILTEALHEFEHLSSALEFSSRNSLQRADVSRCTREERRLVKCGRQPVCALFTCFSRADVNFYPHVRCISFVPKKPSFVTRATHVGTAKARDQMELKHAILEAFRWAIFVFGDKKFFHLMSRLSWTDPYSYYKLIFIKSAAKRLFTSDVT